MTGLRPAVTKSKTQVQELIDQWTNTVGSWTIGRMQQNQMAKIAIIWGVAINRIKFSVLKMQNIK